MTLTPRTALRRRPAAPGPAALLLAAALAAPALAPSPALAHKVIAAVFPSGRAIEGEIGLSNGEMAPDLPITVETPDGAPLGETVTDADGFFLFTPTRAVTHVFHADLGAGHVARVEMPAAEVAAIVGKSAPTAAAAPAMGSADAPDGPAPDGPAVAASAVAVASLTEEEREAIAAAVRDATRPLRQEISAYKEKNDLQSILGGIGYIVGLFGVAFYLAARRKLQG